MHTDITRPRRSCRVFLSGPVHAGTYKKWIMRKYIGLLIGLCFFSLEVWTAESYCFRVYLKDKGETGFRLDRPEEYLSEVALERRKKRGIEIAESDVPVSPAYLDTLRAAGGTPLVQSKWFSTVVVSASDSLAAARLEQLPMVDSVRWVWKGEWIPPVGEKGERLLPAVEPGAGVYGFAEKQIRMLKGEKLHERGFRGEGMRIAVIDAGFRNVDRISVFDSLKLIGTHNVVYPEVSVFAGDDHGTKVLSCLAADAPGWMVGTAPEASYLLLQSEVSDSEYPVEEDFWVAAVEYADSVGVDVISSSLGYFSFDVEELSFRHADLDGKTALISRAACEAAKKGMLVFCSAGNEGNGEWLKITVPGDACEVLTVGSVDGNKKRSIFSSIGYTADNRVKPDVAAMGGNCCVVDADGQIGLASGTSFSTPVLAGLGACLWQALPDLDNRGIRQLLRESAHRYKKPDPQVGYGIPDLYKAYRKGLKNGIRKK